MKYLAQLSTNDPVNLNKYNFTEDLDKLRGVVRTFLTVRIIFDILDQTVRHNLFQM